MDAVTRNSEDRRAIQFSLTDCYWYSWHHRLHAVLAPSPRVCLLAGMQVCRYAGMYTRDQNSTRMRILTFKAPRVADSTPFVLTYRLYDFPFTRESYRVKLWQIQSRSPIRQPRRHIDTHSQDVSMFPNTHSPCIFYFLL